MRNEHLRKQSIDLGLSVLCATAKTGQTLSTRAIAEVCDCHRNVIFYAEKSALKKLRIFLSEKGYKQSDLLD